MSERSKSGPPSPAVVLIVEDDEIFGRACERVARRVAPVIRVPRIRAAREVLRRETVRLALVDEGLEDGSGLEFLGEVRTSQSRDATMILVTGQHDPSLAARAMLRGAFYISKGADPSSDEGWLLRHLDTLVERAMVDVDLQKARAAAASWLSDDIRATACEHEIVELIALGAEPRELARILGKSQNTIDTHLKNLRAKLGVTGSAASLAAAMQEEISERLIRAHCRGSAVLDAERAVDALPDRSSGRRRPRSST